MAHNPQQINNIKKRMIELYLLNPDIKDGQMARIFKMDYRTVAKYRSEIMGEVNRRMKLAEERIEKKINPVKKWLTELFRSG